MEPKKNPKKDMNRNRGLYFVSGLALILLLTYVALEWKFYEKKNYVSDSMNHGQELVEEIPPIVEIKLPEPPKPSVAPPIIEIVDDDTDIVDTPITSTETNQDMAVLEVEEIIYEEVEEDIPVPINAVEIKPVFPGCEDDSDKLACFNRMILKHVRKTFRYPEIAQEMGIQGKVHMNFVIQKDGSIGEIKILRSPDDNLGKEANRIISRLPKMEPGKQAGKPVKVPFSIPITFKLN